MPLLFKTILLLHSVLRSRAFAQQCPYKVFSTARGSMTISLADFLVHRRSKLDHLVIGNEAGDADSIVSAIGLAYVEQTKTPVVSIPKADLTTQRPETFLLLQWAGVDPSWLLYIDDEAIQSAQGVAVTLVDHNRLTIDKDWTVEEIVDHHSDEGQHLDTCQLRDIAFNGDQALVASTCTMVVERLKELHKPPYPSSLSVLLLGVILLDSVNMSPKAGKGTARDVAAIQTLLDDTDWTTLSPKAQEALALTDTKPSTDVVFERLQQAKFDASFWQSLSVRDALRLDYKAFSVGDNVFGVSTVLLPLQDFINKSDVMPAVDAYMNDVGVNLLGVMLTFTDDRGHLHRQLMFVSKDSFPLENMVDFLEQQETLQLSKVDAKVEEVDSVELSCFDQGNSKASRKQVAPILIQYFEQS